MSKEDNKVTASDIVQEHSYLGSKKCKLIDLEWQNLSVDSTKTLKKKVNGKKISVVEHKRILNHVSGVITHGTFTAIMGPSGCGKTTLLNVLSNRSDSKLQLRGKLFLNSHQIPNIDSIGNLVAFVQQDDVLLPTITPREIFTFTANLRLSMSKEEKKKTVESLLAELGLLKCADTRVGNNLMRGLSGGERKRTSIGVELITNPSMVFLDEPTTGLDSTTALKIIQLLVHLAKTGRTIVSVIHQPSSEIFSEFDYLMLMVRGDIIYSGLARNTVQYFDGIGYTCPKLTNPADYFMKLMSETGMIVEEIQQGKDSGNSVSLEAEEIEKRFKVRLEAMISAYKKDLLTKKEKLPILNDLVENKSHFQTSWCSQFALICSRSLKNEVRNPLDFTLKIVQNLVFSICILILWNNLGHGLTSIQDRTGVLFMMATCSCMVALGGSMNVFQLERPVFIRERKSQSYRTTAYFWAKSAAEFPFFVFYPLLFVSITYYAVGFNTYSVSKFFLAICIHFLCYIAGSGIGLTISTFVPSVELAMAILPMTMVPLFAFAGFFVNQDQVPYFFYEFKYISPFKYGFQALMYNEYTDLYTLTCGSNPRCDALAMADFQESMLVSIICLIAIGVGFRLVAIIGLEKISTPKSAKLLPPTEEENKRI